MTMKKGETTCVLAFALIFIGSVCDQLNVKGYPMAVENETKISSAGIPETKIFGRLGINGLALHGIVHDIIPNITHTPTKKNEEVTTFCNHSFKSIDAAMVVEGKVMLFVDKGAVIDGRYEIKTLVPFVFLRGPDWVQAAVYYQKTETVYLFKDDRIFAYFNSNRNTFHQDANIASSNKNYYSPECAIWYLDSDIMYILKKGYLYEFNKYAMNILRWRNKLRSPLQDLTCDAAISFGHKLYFIVENAVIEIPENHWKKNITEMNFSAKSATFFLVMMNLYKIFCNTFKV